MTIHLWILVGACALAIIAGVISGLIDVRKAKKKNQNNNKKDG